MIVIDVPQIAYKTWGLEYRIYDKDGNRLRDKELEAEMDLKKSLSRYEYSAENEHVR
jgi:hypothetical protein